MSSVTNTKCGIWSIENALNGAISQCWQYAGDKKEPGAIWTWGSGAAGRLGINQGTLNKSSPIQIPGSQWTHITVGEYHSMAIKSDGTLWGWGTTYRGELGTNNQGPGFAFSSPVQTPGTNWICVVAPRGRFTMALKSDNTLWTWGCNGSGQLGDGTTINRSSPVQVPGTAWNELGGTTIMGMATKTDGTLWTWGSGYCGMLSNNSTIGRCSPEQVPGNQWVGLACGLFHTSARKTDGTLWAWGAGAVGRLGTGTPIDRSSPNQVPGNQWVDVAAGNVHGMARKIDGSLWVWGNQIYGMQGVNCSGQSPIISPVQLPGDWLCITASHHNSFGIKRDNTLWAWGQGTNGLIADDQACVGRSAPFQIPGRWNEVRAGCFHVVAKKTI
jgi:alpha-tubulin suppressor-like RCC1 family protein